MNQDERKQTALEIRGMAQYYARTIDPQVLGMMVDDLDDLPLNEVLCAFRAYRRDPKNRTFPLPAQIRGLIRPVMTSEAGGRELALKIKQAISDFGWSNPEQARNFIGPDGWEIVRGWGGWSYVCENLGTAIDVNSFYAQVRDRAKDVIEHKGITFSEAPQLEAPRNEGLNNPFANLLKDIVVKKAEAEAKSEDEDFRKISYIFNGSKTRT